MRSFVATLGPGHHGNWAICTSTGLWGIVGRGTNWLSGARSVQAGDDICIWRGGSPNGFIALAKAQSGALYVGDPGFAAPWPNPELFGAVVPIAVVAELDRPAGDDFSTPGRVGRRFGFNNTVLQHGFEAITRTQAERVLSAFGELVVGLPFVEATPVRGVTPAAPFTVDPDLVDRGRAAHERVVGAIASWVSRRDLVPLLPNRHDPLFDLAWVENEVLNVVEVKSTTHENVESQLRLGLGQVLRYRELLRRRRPSVRAWLVAEQVFADGQWEETCASVDVQLRQEADFS